MQNLTAHMHSKTENDHNGAKTNASHANGAHARETHRMRTLKFLEKSIWFEDFRTSSELFLER